MAPKQSKGKRPILHAFTEDDLAGPAVDTFRFFCLEAEAVYMEQTDERAVIAEAVLNYLNSPKHALDGVLAAIESRQWGFVPKKQVSPNATLVREFYANMLLDDQLHVQIREKRVPVSPQAIAMFLRVPFAGRDDYQRLSERPTPVFLDEVKDFITYPGAEWVLSKENPPARLRITSSMLTIEARAWFRLVCSFLLPTGHCSDVPISRMILVYCLLKGKSACVGTLVRNTMNDVRRKARKDALPFACLITRICRATYVEKLPTDDLAVRMDKVEATALIKADVRLNPNLDPHSRPTQKRAKKSSEPIDAPDIGGSSHIPPPSPSSPPTVSGDILQAIEDMDTRLREEGAASNAALKKELKAHATQTVANSEKRIMSKLT